MWTSLFAVLQLQNTTSIYSGKEGTNHLVMKSIQIGCFYVLVSIPWQMLLNLQFNPLFLSGRSLKEKKWRVDTVGTVHYTLRDWGFSCYSLIFSHQFTRTILPPISWSIEADLSVKQEQMKTFRQKLAEERSVGALASIIWSWTV